MTSYLRFLRDNAPFLSAGLLFTVMSSFGQTFFISVFAGEIMEAFDLSNGGWGLIYTLGTTASAVVMVWAGALTDRFRARALGLAVMLLLAFACTLMALVPGHWNAALVLVIFLLRFAGQGMMTHIAMVAMARWFVGTRGRALSIASMGAPLGQAIFPVIFVAAMGFVSWRVLWLVAALVLLIATPIAQALLRQERTPQAISAGGKGDGAAGMLGLHWTRAMGLKHWLFWAMIPVILGPPAWGTALFFQQVNLAEVKGWTLAGFVALMPLFTAVAVASTFVSGWALDRVGAGRLLPLAMIPWAAGFALMAQAQSLVGAGLALVLIGIGSGAQSTLPAAFWAEYYGTRHIGSIKAAAAAVMVFGSAIGPGVSGVLIDAGISFPSQMLGYSAYFLAAGLCTFLALRAVPRPSAQPA
ncbi:MFS transporter [Pseudoroseicyclus aestuarii]|uniref:MFS transporter n=1 Tax=Pseudoroseicyclus aestuarii TaxID=1795041 RepID=A0A318SRK7_9RHOB|nr:MFS transporter [Pseudoroseicyclus aestuarii]PYE84450.1 MFS transporter [Pseudoroseicyclus aestuarii]